ncbi:N-acylphosphatidylethanolamine synthase [Raphanus sativus]|uniref:Tafazzin family protein n=2 Tax=Raphanus sativus TaxID=3726 RepID=A0A6J0LBC4_RAPSA|nr:N-acylphosphatidylethanolamine synthase isoform X1 [Raphanus sativus]KAJ4874472.1 N-acylphosphatidylethanolamine synthase [Raphanus sativus]
MGRIMEWAARSDHLRGVPRKAVITAVGAFARAVANLCNKTTAHNADTLMTLVRSRPPGVPLITVSNHMSTLDDPVMWGGFKGLLSFDPELARWVLAAEDICFKNPVFSYIFRTGKCIPITRGGGIYQEHMSEALERLKDGSWLHTFPEGKVFQEDVPIRRLKWGTASLIARCPVTPIVLPIIHRGFDEMMPEKYFYGRRPPLPLCNKNLKVVVGEPIEFDLPMMVQTAVSASSDHVTEDTLQEAKWPVISSAGQKLDETAQRCLYTALSQKIQSSLESLRLLAKRL